MKLEIVANSCLLHCGISDVMQCEMSAVIAESYFHIVRFGVARDFLLV